MDHSKSDLKMQLRKISFKILRAVMKVTLIFAAYLILWMFLAPISSFVPNLQQILETFVAVYVVLMTVGELTSGTIYAHFLSVAKAMFVLLYLMLSLKDGLLGTTFQNVSLVVDFRLFLMFSMLISLLGLARSVLQVISYLNERAENVRL